MKRRLERRGLERRYGGYVDLGRQESRFVGGYFLIKEILIVVLFCLEVIRGSI
jgi:hypothetical protein